MMYLDRLARVINRILVKVYLKLGQPSWTGFESSLK